MPQVKPKAKEATRLSLSFFASPTCSLPLWDDNQVAQENWGAVLTATTATGGVGSVVDLLTSAATGVKETTRQGKGGGGGGNTSGAKDVQGGSAFCDAEGHQALEQFINAQYRLYRAPVANDYDAVSHDMLDDSVAANAQHVNADVVCGTVVHDGGDTPVTAAAADNDVHETKVETAAPPTVTWRRPAEVMKPFRPVVHRNATPFVNPYASTDQLHPLDTKAEEARCHFATTTTNATSNVTPGGGAKRGNAAAANGGGSSAATGSGGEVGGHHHTAHDTSSSAAGPIHLLYPETISVMQDLVGQDVEQWRQMHGAEAVRRYRGLAPLMEPYDPTLVSGCAETPAEACASRYSTDLRHRLTRAEALAALEQLPPFLMRGFNSVLKTIEHAQHAVAAGHYLWELIYPHAPGTCHPVYNPAGKYAVKLYVEGAYRKVVIDDLLPVDELGRPLLTITSRSELWPALLVKAVLKALGAGAHRVLQDEPEQLIGCLVGNWIPQYIATKDAAVERTAVLLQYRHYLLTSRRARRMAELAELTSGGGRSPVHDDGVTTPLPTQEEGTTAEKATGDEAGNNSEDGAPMQPLFVGGLRTSRWERGGDQWRRACGPATQLYSITEVEPFRNTLALRVSTTPETDLCEGVFEREQEAKDVQRVLLSALRDRAGGAWPVATAAASQTLTHPASEGGATPGGGPPSGVAGGSTTTGAALPVPPGEGSSSLTSCWLTLEELSAQMDRLVVWHCFDQRYAHHVSVDWGSATSALTTTMAPTGGGPTPGQKKVVPGATGGGGNATAAASATALTGAQSGALPPGKRCVVQWWHISCARESEVALVGYTPAPDLVTDAAAAITTTLPEAETMSTAAKSTTRAPPSTTPAAVMAASVTLEPTANDAGGAGGMVVQLDYYCWRRANPLNAAAELRFECGKLATTMLRLPAGEHLYRLTVREMGRGDRLTLLANAPMALFAEATEAERAMGVYSVADAGVHPAVNRAEEEVVWLKRRIRVASTTRLSAVLSTLPPGEDVQAHRQMLHMPVVKGKGGLAGAAAAGGRAGNAAGLTKTGSVVSGKGGGGAASQLAASAQAQGVDDQLDERLCDIPVIRYTTLLLINLDDRNEVRLGEVGHLTEVQVEPNERGFLVVAYARIPAADVPAILAAFASTGGAATNGRTATPPSSGAESGLHTVTAKGSATESSTSPTSATTHCGTGMMYGAGLWKLVLRSDKELAAFDAIALDASRWHETGTLSRGGTATLFRTLCTVTEPTHVTAVMDLTALGPMPFGLRISSITNSASLSVSVSPAAGTTTAAAATTATNGHGGAAGKANALATLPPDVSLARPKVQVYTSGDVHGGHLFLPDVLLEPIERVKATTYLLEGYVSERHAMVWDEHCRRTQEARFIDTLQSARAGCVRRRQRELDDIAADPVAYLARGKEQLLLQQQQQQQQQQSQTASHGGTESTAVNVASATGGNPATGREAASAVAGRRRRSADHNANGGKRQTNTVTPSGVEGADAAVGTSGGHSSSHCHDLHNTLPELPPPLDATDDDLIVGYDVHVTFSVPRVEVRSITPSEDAVGAVRQHFRGVLQQLRDRVNLCGILLDAENSHYHHPLHTHAVGAGAATMTPFGLAGPAAGGATGAPSAARAAGGNAGAGTAGGLSAASAAKQAKLQRDAAAAEEQLRSEQARRCRQHYLGNPDDLFIPRVVAGGAVALGGGDGVHTTRDGSNTAVGMHLLAENKSSKAAVPPPQIVTEHAVDDNYRHAPVLSEAEYSVRLLPIRAIEVCPATPSEADGAMASSSQPAAGPGGGVGRESRRGGRLATAAAAATASASAQRSNNGATVTHGGVGAASAGNGGTVGNAHGIVVVGGAAEGGGGGVSTYGAEIELSGLRERLMQYTEGMLDAVRDRRTEQRRGRQKVKQLMSHYWFNQTHPELTATPTTNTTVTATASELANTLTDTFPSLLGAREEDCPPGRTRRGMTNVS